MKKGLILISCLLMLTGCFFYKVDYIASSPGHLTSVRKITKLDDRMPKLLNDFAINLYEELYEADKNLFISPASIYLALGMTYNGANGDTALEMAKVLGIEDMSLTDFNELSRDLQYLMLGYEKTKFELANSIWIRDTYEELVKDDFLDRNKEYYGAMISAIDFDDPKAKDTINYWVNKNTKGRIKKAIEEPIHPLTVMFLINTIYFKADWQVKFDPQVTTDDSFHTVDKTKTVKMMNKIDNLGYIEDDMIQGVMLPYNDGKTSMIILLPKDADKVNLSNLDEWINKMKNNKVSVNLKMPRVKVEYEISLEEPLSKLGMPNSFTGLADFSKMADKAQEHGLHIADVTHKSFLAIDEKGTEAAAMTKVEMKVESAPQADYIMHVNRPFVLGIIDNDSESLLFLGRIVNP
jgi:serine protease inhibitor